VVDHCITIKNKQNAREGQPQQNWATTTKLQEVNKMAVHHIFYSSCTSGSKITHERQQYVHEVPDSILE
jgi:hypothetical protein